MKREWIAPKETDGQAICLVPSASVRPQDSVTQTSGIIDMTGEASMSNPMINLEAFREKERGPYPNYGDAPNPISPTSPSKEHISHGKTLRDYENDI